VIPYLRLRHRLRAVGRAELPPFKGSLLRGAFGHALRRSVCLMGPEQPCATCRLRQVCAYTRLFETFLEGEPPPFLRGLETSPRPYVFEPGTEARVFEPGDPLEFDLLLFGQALDLQAYALLAVERMAAAGLGRQRFPFELARVEAQEPSGSWRTVLDNGRPAGSGPSGSSALGPCLPPAELQATRARLHFLTPTRLKVNHRLAPAVDFRSLLFLLLRRTLEIAHCHVPGAQPDWNLRPLLQQADAVRVADSRLTWRDLERYSNRQKQKTPLGGFTGTLDLEGDLAPFAAPLRTAEVLHVGKGATFGLGRVRVEILG
jgi:hypothetical protein